MRFGKNGVLMADRPPKTPTRRKAPKGFKLSDVDRMNVGQARAAQKELRARLQNTATPHAEMGQIPIFLAALVARLRELGEPAPQMPAKAGVTLSQSIAERPLRERVADARAALHGAPDASVVTRTDSARRALHRSTDDQVQARARAIREGWGRP